MREYFYSDSGILVLSVTESLCANACFSVARSPIKAWTAPLKDA